jgi:predicted nucleotidyltransferase
MASDEAIPAWLSVRLHHNSSLHAAYQFGSSLSPAARPNDIDLVLVSVDGAGEPAWRDALALASELRVAFPLVFRIPLSAMVLTPSEWDELDGVIVRERRSLLE